MSISNPSAFAMVEPKAELDTRADSPAIRFRRHEQPLIAERRPWQHDLEATAVGEDGHDGNSDLAAFEAQYELGASSARAPSAACTWRGAARQARRWR